MSQNWHMSLIIIMSRSLKLRFRPLQMMDAAWSYFKNLYTRQRNERPRDQEGRGAQWGELPSVVFCGAQLRVH